VRIGIEGKITGKMEEHKGCQRGKLQIGRDSELKWRKRSERGCGVQSSDLYMCDMLQVVGPISPSILFDLEEALCRRHQRDSNMERGVEQHTIAEVSRVVKVQISIEHISFR
jgi:hypothetical protein